MLSVLEMIFRCVHCATPRQYGIAANFSDRPDNPNPTISCAPCRRATEHRFDAVKLRTDSRERKLRAEMKTDAIYGTTH